MAYAEILTLIIFTAILSKSAGVVVDNASKLARFFRISQLAIGMLLIAVSTSLPELSVSVISSAAHEGAIAAGNVFGSNIANITLVLGTAAVINPIFVQLKVFVVALLFAVIANMAFFYFATARKSFGRREGALMLALYAAYIMLIFFLQFGDVPPL